MKTSNVCHGQFPKVRSLMGCDTSPCHWACRRPEPVIKLVVCKRRVGMPGNPAYPWQAIVYRKRMFLWSDTFESWEEAMTHGLGMMRSLDMVWA